MFLYIVFMVYCSHAKSAVGSLNTTSDGGRKVHTISFVFPK
jgi:hypothetical protein